MSSTLVLLATLAEILGGLAVIGGVVFGVVQIRQYRRQRVDSAAIELMRSMLTDHFIRTYRMLYALPDGLSVSEFREMGQEYEDAAFSIGTVFESLGYMVFRGVVPLDLVSDLIGGVATGLWRKVEKYFEEIRVQQGQPLIVEWYQWLVERLEESGSVSRRPAFERFAGWTPPLGR